VKQPQPPMRVVTQYRSRRTMVYELEFNGVVFDIHVTPRETDASPGDWCVEVRTSHAADAVSLLQWGPTRAEALAGLAREWGSQTVERRLPICDWEAVAQVLTAVKAI
jgi:hypothetical protein